MALKVRRVITGHDANGKAIVLEDGFAPNIRTNPNRPGHISTELWKTNAMPVCGPRKPIHLTEVPVKVNVARPSVFGE